MSLSVFFFLSFSSPPLAPLVPLLHFVQLPLTSRPRTASVSIDWDTSWRERQRGRTEGRRDAEHVQVERKAQGRSGWGDREGETDRATRRFSSVVHSAVRGCTLGAARILRKKIIPHPRKNFSPPIDRYFIRKKKIPRTCRTFRLNNDRLLAMEIPEE